MAIDQPLEGRIIPAGIPLPPGANPYRTHARVTHDAPTPAPAAERPAPPGVYEIHVRVTAGADLSPVEAETHSWWRPAYTLRTAIVGALGLMPLPSIGAPAAHWALLLGDTAAEQSLGAAWTIAGAGVLGALAVDRGRRRWDRDEQAWRPGWIARGLLCAAISGACLALPVADGLVYLLTGVQPS